MIYIIGDSHSDSYKWNGNYFIPSTPGTMYRVGKNGLQDRLTNVTLTTNDILLVVVGEIDIRCHFYKQINENNRNEDEIINTLAESFISRLKDIKLNTGCNIIVRGVVPPLPNANHPDIHSGNPEDLTYLYPIRGHIKDRSRWRQSLNKKLETLCLENKLYFLPSPKWVEDNDGMLIDRFSDHVIHIANCNKEMNDELFTFIKKMIFNQKNDNIYYVSLTTIPSRLGNIKQIINSLQNQTIKPKKIFLHIPYHYKRNDISHSDIIIPDLSEYNNVYINICSDMGSNAKFLPMLSLDEISDNDKILICDDDIEYNSNLASTLLEISNRYINSAVCMFGVTNAQYFSNNSWIVDKNTQDKYPCGFRGIVEGYIDIFEGFKGVMLKKKFFKQEDLKIPDCCLYCDDIYLSGCVIKNGFAIVCANKHLDDKVIQVDTDSLNGLFDKRDKNYRAVKYMQDTYNIFMNM